MNEQSVEELNDKIPMEEKKIEGKHLISWIEEHLLGIPISYVVQIVRMQKITVMPDYPAYTKRIFNLWEGT